MVFASRQLMVFETKFQNSQVENTIQLFDNDCTVPFIARYRKEVTGQLDEVEIENLKERYGMLEGIVLLDTLGDLDDYGDDLKTISRATGLPILEKKKVGLQGFQDVIEEAIGRLEYLVPMVK